MHLPRQTHPVRHRRRQEHPSQGPGRRRWFAAFLLGVAAVACGEPTAAITYDGGDFVDTLNTGFGPRTYYVHVPSGLSADRPTPLIFAFHGVGITALQMRNHTGLNAAADREGFVAVYPESALGFWDIQGGSGAEDVKFTENMITAISNAIAIDQQRIFVTGLSNGGLFVQWLACVLSDRIAGFASVAATMLRTVAFSCDPARPLAAMFVLGTEDTFFPWPGTSTTLPALQTIEFWTRQNDCQDTADLVTLPDTAGDGTTIEIRTFTGCHPEGPTVWYTVQNGGHAWPGPAIPLNPEVIGLTTNNAVANDFVLEFFGGVERR